MRCHAPGDLGLDVALAQQPAVFVVVVATIRGHALGSPARPTHPAGDGWNAVDQRDQLGDVVAIAAGERPGEREPGRVYEEMML